jgi:hypothetical protein
VELQFHYTAREGGSLLKEQAISELQTAVNEILSPGCGLRARLPVVHMDAVPELIDCFLVEGFLEPLPRWLVDSVELAKHYGANCIVITRADGSLGRDVTPLRSGSCPLPVTCPATINCAASWQLMCQVPGRAMSAEVAQAAAELAAIIVAEIHVKPLSIKETA